MSFRILFTGGCLQHLGGVPGPGGCLVGGGLVLGGSGPGGAPSGGCQIWDTPPDSYCCRRYASYWKMHSCYENAPKTAMQFMNKYSEACWGERWKLKRTCHCILFLKKLLNDKTLKWHEVKNRLLKVFIVPITCCNITFANYGCYTNVTQIHIFSCYEHAICKVRSDWLFLEKNLTKAVEFQHLWSRSIFICQITWLFIKSSSPCYLSPAKLTNNIRFLNICELSS